MKVIALLFLVFFLLGCVSQNTEPEKTEIDLNEMEKDIFEEINEERSEQNIEVLLFDVDLRKTAKRHSKDMAENDYFNYTSQDGRTPIKRAEDAGYDCIREYENAYSRGIAESIYRANHVKSVFENGEVDEYNTQREIVNEVIDDWIEEEKSNIISQDLTRVGIGVSQEPNGTRIYVTADFC